jgi:predicted nucleic acid-binding protein
VTIVVDASLIAAALVGDASLGGWASELIEGESLTAPHLMAVEVASILRRAVLAGELGDDSATLAHADLLVLPVELFPYEPLAARVWALRSTVTSYDGWYVALAEALDVPLATLDGRLTRAPGPRCQFLVPPAS